MPKRNKRLFRGRHRRDQKIKAVRHLGGRCERCGISEIEVLEFHHVEPKQKSFAISARLGAVTWDALLHELKKCIILCSNCHKLHHAGK